MSLESVARAVCELAAEIRSRMTELDESVPDLLTSAFQDCLQRLSMLNDDIEKIERRVVAWMKGPAACRSIAEIPSVGPWSLNPHMH